MLAQGDPLIGNFENVSFGFEEDSASWEAPGRKRVSHFRSTGRGEASRRDGSVEQAEERGIMWEDVPKARRAPALVRADYGSSPQNVSRIPEFICPVERPVFIALALLFGGNMAERHMGRGAEKAPAHVESCADRETQALRITPCNQDYGLLNIGGRRCRLRHSQGKQHDDKHDESGGPEHHAHGTPRRGKRKLSLRAD